MDTLGRWSVSNKPYGVLRTPDISVGDISWFHVLVISGSEAYYGVLVVVLPSANYYKQPMRKS